MHAINRVAFASVLSIILASSLFAQNELPNKLQIGEPPASAVSVSGSSGPDSALDRRVRQLEIQLAEKPVNPQSDWIVSLANNVRIFVESFAAVIPALGSIAVIPFARKMLKDSISTNSTAGLAALNTLGSDALLKKAYFDILEERKAIARRSLLLSSVGVSLTFIGASVAFFEPIASAVTAGSGIITTIIGTLFGKRQTELDHQTFDIMKQLTSVPGADIVNEAKQLPGSN